MSARIRTWLWIFGSLCMLIALGLQSVTLANGRYASVLLTALGLMLLADAVLAAAAWRGGVRWRIAVGVAALPSIFIPSDFLRRAPHAF